MSPPFPILRLCNKLSAEAEQERQWDILLLPDFLSGALRWLLCVSLGHISCWNNRNSSVGDSFIIHNILSILQLLLWMQSSIFQSNLPQPVSTTNWYQKSVTEKCSDAENTFQIVWIQHLHSNLIQNVCSGPYWSVTTEIWTMVCLFKKVRAVKVYIYTICRAFFI